MDKIAKANSDGFNLPPEAEVKAIGAFHWAFIFIAHLVVLSAAIPFSGAIAQSAGEKINMVGQNLSTNPTFDCATAKSATARIICLDQAGATADWDLTAAYWARSVSLDETARGGFDQTHDDWFQSLNQTCRLKPDQTNVPAVQRQCVLTAYRKRAESYRSQLSGDALYESRLSPEQHGQIQSELIDLGFLNDAADGEFGPNTRAAIGRFQAQSGFTQSQFLTGQQRQQLVQAKIPTVTEQSVSSPGVPTSPPMSTPSSSSPNRVLESAATDLSKGPSASPPPAQRAPGLTGQSTSLAAGTSPSFACKDNLLPTEAVICSYDYLASLDRQLGAAFGGEIRNLPAGQQAELRSSEKAWIIERNSCGTNMFCISSAYHVRISALASLISPPLGAQSPPALPRIPSPQTVAAQTPAGSNSGASLAEAKSGELQSTTPDDKKGSFKNYVVATGGCGNVTTPRYDNMPLDEVQQGKVNIDLFGKPVLKWSDDDIVTAVSIYRDCFARIHEAIIATCVRGGYSNSYCEQRNPAGSEAAFFGQKFENQLRNVIVTARNLVNQRDAQQQAKNDLEKVQAENKRVQAEEAAQQKVQALREQAQHDQEATEEAAQAAAREEPKIAQAAKEAEEAQRARHEAEQRLAEIRNRIAVLGAQASQSKLEEQRARAEQTASAHWYEEFSAAYNRGDFATAKSIAAPLAEQGIARAQDALALLYSEGKGVLQDYAEAMRWYRRAANQGDGDAESMIGFMYRDGKGVPQDYIRAYLWLNLAARSTEPAAAMWSISRDVIARNFMTPAQLAEAKKVVSEGWEPEAASDATSSAITKPTPLAPPSQETTRPVSSRCEAQCDATTLPACRGMEILRQALKESSNPIFCLTAKEMCLRKCVDE